MKNEELLVPRFGSHLDFWLLFSFCFLESCGCDVYFNPKGVRFVQWWTEADSNR
jgi:hypothetical protein